MRVLTLLLRYGATKYPTAEEEITEIFARQMPDVARDTLIVDSSLRPGHVESLGAHRTLIGGDNSYSEWSAADSGLAFLGDQIWSYDLVNLATAAFNTLYTRYLECFESRLLRAVLAHSCCLGHIDCYNEPIRFRSFTSQHWVRTSFVFLRPEDLKALGSLVSFAEPSRLFSGDSDRPFAFDAHLSQNYKTYIHDWLVGADIGQGVVWHSARGLTAEGLGEFERKAMAIINEHLFAIRLRALGCQLVDVTWLATQLQERPSVEVDLSLGWQAQLAGRGRDPLHLPEAVGP